MTRPQWKLAADLAEATQIFSEAVAQNFKTQDAERPAEPDEDDAESSSSDEGLEEDVMLEEEDQESSDEVFRARALQLKEERAEEVKHHLMVLWADFFTEDHRKQFSNLDDLFWQAIHQAGDAKKSIDPAEGEKLIGLIDQIADIFWQTDKAKGQGVYPPS